MRYIGSPSLAALAALLALSTTTLAQEWIDDWPPSAQGSALYQCHWGQQGHNHASLMVWVDGAHRVVAMSSPREDIPLPAWVTAGAAQRDFNALFRSVVLQVTNRRLVADRSGRGWLLRVQDRMAACVRSAED